jgi:predicted DNA-binding protein (UPF0251 family)
MAISKSSEAVLWLQANPSATQAEAAERFGIDKTTLSRALTKRSKSEFCPCCGQTMKKRKEQAPRNSK